MTLLPVLGNPGYKQRLHHTTILLYFKESTVYECVYVLVHTSCKPSVCARAYVCVSASACACVLVCVYMQNNDAFL